jgi:TorA maturation chaperone TorD
MQARVDELRAVAALLGVPDGDAREAVADLARRFPWLDPAARELQTLPLEQWQAEHTRLFVTGFPVTPCPPFESAYREGRLFGAAVDELEDFYARLGRVSIGAPADYLGTLLECAAWLEADPDSRPVYRDELWRGHLAHWLPRFCADLDRHSRLRLYRAVADWLRALSPLPQPGGPGDA